MVCGECLTDLSSLATTHHFGDYAFPLSREVQRFKDHGESWHVEDINATARGVFLLQRH
ncbi:hypothetical protein [Vibrio sp.]|uniref:hypothetical protein n=1 Tax=Vibrio sp. TaxID=678 RepID=UPI003AA8F7FE